MSNYYCDHCTPTKDIWDNEINKHLFTPARTAEAITNLSGYIIDLEERLTNRINQLENDLTKLEDDHYEYVNQADKTMTKFAQRLSTIENNQETANHQQNLHNPETTTQRCKTCNHPLTYMKNVDAHLRCQYCAYRTTYNQ